VTLGEEARREPRPHVTGDAGDQDVHAFGLPAEEESHGKCGRFHQPNRKYLQFPTFTRNALFSAFSGKADCGTSPVAL
jgi:hypothetical protein